jgi:hypothetical protein
VVRQEKKTSRDRSDWGCFDFDQKSKIESVWILKKKQK